MFFSETTINLLLAGLVVSAFACSASIWGSIAGGVATCMSHKT